MNRIRQQGYNLIEIVVVVGVLALLLAMGVPAMSDWIANSRVRTAAEGMLNGMQLARAEAVRRNSPVNLNIGADGISWDVALPPPDGTVLQTRAADAGIGISAAATRTRPNLTDTPVTITSPSVTFNGWGLLYTNIAGTMEQTAAVAIRYTSAAPGARAMCAVIVANTPRLCDPQRTDANDPRACFSGGVAIPGC